MQVKSRFVRDNPVNFSWQVDISTISWSEVVRRIEAIREENPLTAISSNKGRNGDNTTTAKLDAHDIANRIMRQENYLIALFNKELLDLRVPWPAALKRFAPEERGKGQMLTQALEWNIRFCLMEYLFDAQGRVRKPFLQSRQRAVLIEGFVTFSFVHKLFMILGYDAGLSSWGYSMPSSPHLSSSTLSCIPSSAILRCVPSSTNLCFSVLTSLAAIPQRSIIH